MKKEIFNNDLEVLSEKAVDSFFEVLNKLSFSEDKIFIALSGGNSVRIFYEKILENSHYLEQEVWDKIIFCLADERLVELDSKFSNYREVMEVFLRELVDNGLILKNQIIPINYDNDFSKIVKDYNFRVEKIDVAIIGSGSDSHTCSLFPEHDSIRNEEKKYIFVENSPKEPSNRISISKKMFDDIKNVFLFFIGNNKRDAYYRFYNESLSEDLCPTKVSLRSKNLFVVTNISD